jgi:hypothetical protein
LGTAVLVAYRNLVGNPVARDAKVPFMTPQNVNRRRFLAQSAGATVLLVTPLAAHQPQPSVPPRPPALAPDLVRDFVQKAHSDLAGTKALLTDHPTLLNATWDWGGGDFETAIGGAGHMGNRAIAEFLVSQGARFDIFVAAMLGNIDYVRAALTTWPHLVHSKGPHGIPLLRHARAGGEPAAAVADYLLSKGAA